MVAFADYMVNCLPNFASMATAAFLQFEKKASTEDQAWEFAAYRLGWDGVTED